MSHFRRHRPLATMALCQLLFAFSGSVLAAPVEQQWIGEFRLDGEAVPFVLHDRSANADTASSVDLPAFNARDVALTSLASTPTTASFGFDGPPGSFRFEGTVAGGEMQGKVAKGKASGDFSLFRLQPMTPAQMATFSGSYEIAPGHVIDLGRMGEMDMLVFLDQKTLREGALYPLGDDRFVSGPTLSVPYPFAIEARFQRGADGSVTGLRWKEGGKDVEARRIAPHRVEPVTIVHGDVTLKGSLTLPAGPGPHPAVVFAHGSGPATRDVAFWNMYFVRLGMAVLSLDKRGAGESTGDWTKASLDDIAGDWLAGVEMLKQRKDIDGKRIGVHGSSQGGWTAPLMAARSKDIAFVIVRVGSGVNLVDTMVHEIGWSARDAGASEAVALEAESAARTMFGFAKRNAPWSEVEAFVATQKGKPSSQFAWPLNWSKDGWGFPWSRLNGGYDATDSLRKTRVPMLWYLADLDHNVPSDASAKRLLAVTAETGHPDFQLKRLPRTGHGFIASDTGSNNEYHLASHFTPGYFDSMEIWLRERGFLR